MTRKKMSALLKRMWERMLIVSVMFFSFNPIALAAEPVTGDKAGNWILGWLKWGVVVVVGYLSIKEFIKGAKVVALVTFVAGAILYAYLNDPEGFLNGLKFIPDFFTGK